MPDAAVVKCHNCGWHQTIVQRVPALSEYYNCAKCATYQPVHVVRRMPPPPPKKPPLRQLGEHNAAATSALKSARHGRQPGLGVELVLRSYDVEDMRRHATELNEERNVRRMSASLSRQRVRVYSAYSQRAIERLQKAPDAAPGGAKPLTEPADRPTAAAAK
mmetsp:Transcript_3849/g.10034  ORF Transcript_3849/g.10034 Transcript_3849/m.10034 type:complete len:162 (+) Transcript_3849:57-542(+)